MKETVGAQFNLTTERLILRQLRETDAPVIAGLRSDSEVNRYIDRAAQLSVDGAKAFIEKVNGNIKNGTGFYWAICKRENDELIGTACVFNFSDDKRKAELGYELRTEFQGQGFAGEAVKQVIKFAFANAGFNCLEACVHRDHTKSINLLLKNGFMAEPDKKEEKYPDYTFYILYAPE